MSKAIPWALILILVLGGYFYISNQRFKYNQDKLIWEAEAEELKYTIEDTEKRAERERKRANEALLKANDEAKIRSALERELEVERIEHEKVLANITTLAPDQLVLGHHFHLDEDSLGVWLTESGLVFSISASRKNLTKLTQLQFCLDVKIPKQAKMLSSANEEITDLRKAIIGYNNSMAAMGDEIDSLKLYGEGEHKLRLKAEKMVGFNLFAKETVLVAVVAFIAGGVISSIL